MHFIITLDNGQIIFGSYASGQSGRPAKIWWLDKMAAAAHTRRILFVTAGLVATSWYAGCVTALSRSNEMATWFIMVLIVPKAVTVP